jgi:putative membrane protein
MNTITKPKIFYYFPQFTVNQIVIFTVVMHLAGFIGLQWTLTRAWFEALIPFNLVMTALLLAYFHNDWSKSFLFFALVCFLTGYWVEVLGVKTKAIFGDYYYKTALSIKLWDVPLIIGLNWLILVYISGIISSLFSLNIWLKSALGAFLMVFLDYWIEPFAIKYNMWDWAGHIVPLQNYLAWYVVGFCLIFFFQSSSFKKSNPLAFPVYIIQCAFFLAHILFL